MFELGLFRVKRLRQREEALRKANKSKISLDWIIFPIEPLPKTFTTSVSPEGFRTGNGLALIFK